MNTSTNPFADPSIPSLGWVRDQIAVRYDLGHQVRMDLVSACTKTAEWFSLPASGVPASAEFLRAKFKRLHPAHVGVSARRIGNVRSLLLRAFREVGLSTALMPYGCTMTSEWQRLFDAMENRYHKSCLSKFMRFCSRQSIAPHEVDDDVLGRFLIALETESLIDNPRLTHQSACRCWNQSIEEVEGWPQSPVTVPSYQTRIYALPDEHFHPDLLRQIEDYLEHLQGRSLRSGPPRPLKPRSIEAVRGNLRRYLSALHYTGFDVATVRDLRDVVDFAVFEQAMKWFLNRNDGKTSRSIGEIAWAVRVLAVKYLGVDEETERLYGNAVSRLRVRHSGLSPKNRVALAQFDDPDAVRRFLLLPDRLWETAERASGKQARLRAESAVAIELLIYAPIRFTNLRTMRIDEHLSWIGGRLHLRFVEHEVKNGEPLHFILPTFVGRRIREFLDRYHGKYLNEPNLHLFAGHHGRPKDESRLRRQIKRSLFDETGIEMTPHQFRHAAAKLLLDNMPGHYEVVRKMLGHKKLSTVYEAYSGAETQAALDLYDSVILRLKHGEIGDHGHGAQDRPRTGASKLRHASPTSSPFMDPFNPTGKGRRTR